MHQEPEIPADRHGRLCQQRAYVDRDLTDRASRLQPVSEQPPEVGGTSSTRDSPGQVSSLPTNQVEGPEARLLLSAAWAGWWFET